MSLIRQVAQAMDRIAPLCFADRSWDNVGILIEHPSPSRTGVVMLTIDLTPEVLAECIREKVEVIVAYHPTFFSPIKSLTLPRQMVQLSAVAAGMSVYSPHTSLDAVEGGINDWLATLLSDTQTGVNGSEELKIVPIERLSLSENERKHPRFTEKCGMGRLVTLPHPVPFKDLVSRIKKGLQLEHVRVSLPSKVNTTETSLSSSSSDSKVSSVDSNYVVQTIAICAGSGASVFRSISSSEVDVLWTGEMGHHDVLAAKAAGRSVILCEHSNTERGFLKQVLQEKLKKEIGIKGTVLVASADIDPLSVW